MKNGNHWRSWKIACELFAIISHVLSLQSDLMDQRRTAAIGRAVIGWM